MAKVTNTSNTPLFVGGVEIAPHSTVEIDDAALAHAKKAVAVLALFAEYKLKLGDAAAKAEAERKNLYAGTPAGSVKPKQEKTLPARRGVSTEVVVAKPSVADNFVAV